MKDKMTNLFSRKFILTLITTVIGIATIFTAADNTTVKIVGLIVVAVSQIVYNIIEGTIDAKAVISTTAAMLTKISELLENNTKETTDAAEGEKTDTEKALAAIAATTTSALTEE